MIELDDARTWPEAVRSRLSAQRDILVAYEIERRRIDALINSDDIRWRLFPPPNEHESARVAVIREVNSLMANETIAAWHCTRLLPVERARLMSEGLRRHNRALFETRMADAVATGDLSRGDADALLNRSQVEDHGRNDLLHFVLFREALQDEHAVGDLLRNWGGEAIYNLAGRSRRGGATGLTTLGVPAIIEARVPVSDLVNMWISIGERLSNRFLDRLGIATEHGWRCDGTLQRDLPGSLIKRIIGPADSDFEHMTRQRTWDYPLGNNKLASP